MLELSTKPHRDTVKDIRRLIESSPARMQQIKTLDLNTLSNAYSDHVKAKNNFDLNNSDDTMVDLVGSWARMTRVMREMKQKYEEGK